MKKYKVIKPFFKLSEQKNYNIDDIIELTSEDANNMIDYLENANNPTFEISKNDLDKVLKKHKTPYEKSKEGTKGIVYRKTIEEADAEIKELNSKINE